MISRPTFAHRTNMWIFFECVVYNLWVHYLSRVVMSEKQVYNIKLASKSIPTKFHTKYTLFENFLPLIPSSVYRKTWPPSSAGMGKRLNNPKLKEIRDKTNKNCAAPSLAEDIRIFVTIIGPDNPDPCAASLAAGNIPNIHFKLVVITNEHNLNACPSPAKIGHPLNKTRRAKISPNPRIRLATGPARAIRERLYHGRLKNPFCTLLSGSSPAHWTYPPKGRAESWYCVSPIFLEKITGPNPRENFKTFTPNSLETSMWEASWIPITAAIPKMTASIFKIISILSFLRPLQ